MIEELPKSLIDEINRPSRFCIRCKIDQPHFEDGGYYRCYRCAIIELDIIEYQLNSKEGLFNLKLREDQECK